MERWASGRHDTPSMPRSPTEEYKELQEQSTTPWGGLVVTTVAQALYVEGYKEPKTRENAKVWDDLWQPNAFDGRQIAVHRAALETGLSYVSCLPGKDELTGEARSVMRGHASSVMAAFYDDETNDTYPQYTVEGEIVGVRGGETHWALRVMDENYIYLYTATGGRESGPDKDTIKYADTREHMTGVPPVIRFCNKLDLKGDSTGEIAPFIPLFARIDQDTFDRLIVQRFGSWKVRYIAGMAEPETESQRRAAAMALRVEDLLIAENPQAKFGTLDATSLDGYISARDADIRDLAAVSQTPPHNLLGSIANLSAEALAAAEASLMRKVEERKHSFGESWERVLRLGAWQAGDKTAAAAFSSQVRWRDTESRSLAQSADALGKLATMLKVPVEMLWDRIPGWTEQDTADAKKLLEEQGELAALFNSLLKEEAPDQGDPAKTVEKVGAGA